MESVLRGHLVYRLVWHRVLGEQLTLARENSNSDDRHAARVMKNGSMILGHVPRESSSAYCNFIRRGGITRTDVHVCYAHARNECGGNPLKFTGYLINVTECLIYAKKNIL